jgi:type VI secretion system protein ImpJ
MDRPIPDLIQWHEGLLLTPQHFQQLSSRVESLIQALPGWYMPFYWGVRTFDYDRTGLSAGVLTVKYEWTFGDGSAEQKTTSNQIAHSFKNGGGPYTVQVFVTSTLGQTADTFTIINP